MRAIFWLREWSFIQTFQVIEQNPSSQDYIKLRKVYKYGANRAQVNHKYPAILYSWLLCTVKKSELFVNYPLYFSRLMKNEQKHLAEKS